MKKLVKVISLSCAVVFSMAMFSCGDAGKESSEKDELVVKPEIYMPDGAPALSMAKFMANTESNTSNYHVVSASTIVTYVTGENPSADICILPLNAASKNDIPNKYKLLGTVTHGNLYMISDTDIVVDTKSDLNKLIGKTVGVIQLANVPGLTFRTILAENNILYNVLENGGEAKKDMVNLINVEATQILPSAAGGTCDVYIAAEPAISTKLSKVQAFKMVGNLQKLYNEETGYPQAVVVAKNEYVMKYEQWINDFIDGIVSGSEWLKTADAETVVSAVQSHLEEGLTPTFTAANLTTSVINNCSVYYTMANSEEINSFIQKYININENSAKLIPESSIYVKGN